MDLMNRAEYLVGSYNEHAENHAGILVSKNIKHAVITVPAYFDESQRQGIKAAGIAAGLEIIRIIDEPSAAVIAYGFLEEEDRKIIVFDLGDDRLDISFISVEK